MTEYLAARNSPASPSFRYAEILTGPAVPRESHFDRLEPRTDVVTGPLSVAVTPPKPRRGRVRHPGQLDPQVRFSVFGPVIRPRSRRHRAQQCQRPCSWSRSRTSRLAARCLAPPVAHNDRICPPQPVITGASTSRRFRCVGLTETTSVNGYGAAPWLMCRVRRGSTAPANSSVTAGCRSGGQAAEKITVPAPAAWYSASRAATMSGSPCSR